MNPYLKKLTKPEALELSSRVTENRVFEVTYPMHRAYVYWSADSYKCRCVLDDLTFNTAKEVWFRISEGHGTLAYKLQQLSLLHEYPRLEIIWYDAND